MITLFVCLFLCFDWFCFVCLYFTSENPDSVVQSYFSKFEEQWFSYCNEELEKINTFFAGIYGTVYMQVYMYDCTKYYVVSVVTS